MAAAQREAGDVVGGYRVLSRLGAGGSGSVYRVRDDAGHECALKLVDARDDEVAVARLRREVQALQSLRHPAVPRILDAELDDDETFVVFELIDGETLFDHIQRHGPLAGDELADFAERIASALEAVHAAGVVHRDVTPSNVMIGADGPVLIDFGLAHRTDDSRLTREGMVSGTPGYVAPEVIDGAEPGPQADRWSWAATVAYAMTAQAPFGSGTGAISRTLEAEVSLPDAPGAAALRAALGRDLSARPGMRHVVAALRGATEVMPQVPATLVAPVATMQGQFGDGPRAGDRATALDDGQAGADDGRTMVLPSGEHAYPRVAAAAAYADPDGPAGDRDWSSEWPAPAPELDDSGELETVRPVRRRALLSMVALAAVVAAPLAPFLVFVVLLGLAVLARGVFRRALAIEGARERRGEARTSDAVVHTIGLPWHTVRGAAETVPAALMAAVFGGGAAAGGWWLVSSGAVASGSAAAHYLGHAAAVALGAVVAIVILGFGPFMSGTREGAHRVAAALSPTRGVRHAWVVVAIVAILVAGIAVYFQVDPWWWPLPGPPGVD